MPKKILDDFMRPRVGSKIPSRIPSRRRAEDDDSEPVEIHQRRVSLPNTSRSFFSRSIVFSLIGFVALGFAAYWISGVFSRAHVEAAPRTEPVAIAESFSATRGGKEGAIHFEVVKLSATDSVSIPASGEEKVEKKAAGTIMVYNAYSTKAQKLVANTRFKSSSGKIFRTPEAVTVPGASSSDGSVVPGSLAIKVEADAPGEEYNLALTDFTIPGFEGTPKFTKFYGRSKTAMTGGFVGIAKIAPPEAIAAARKDLAETLSKRLMTEVLSEIPEGYAGYESGFKTTFVESSGGGVSGTSTDFVLSGTATVEGVIVQAAELAKVIAQNNVTDYTGDPVEISGLNALAFTLLGKETIDFDAVLSIGFRLEGPAKVIWLFDEQLLLQKIAGTSADEYTAVFREFPTLESVRATITPPWIRRIPSDPSRISLERIID